jgi:NAD(P)-dependent dehydrogenase (short-subunit alcohol dehydrogenase family)
MKYAVTQMMKQDALPSGERGWIVNVASIGGQVGLPLESKLLNSISPRADDVASYCASKGAVMQLTRQVAVDYAPHEIHVNAVCPGFLATAMVRPFLEKKETSDMLHSQSPWPHLGTPEDVAKAVLVLSGDAASWMTGSFLQVDGGFISK